MSLLDHMQRAKSKPLPTLHPGGRVQLEILSAKEVTKQSGREAIDLFLRFVNADGNYAPFGESLFAPKDGDSDENIDRFLDRMHEFQLAFDVDPDVDPDPANWAGKQGWASVKIITDENGEYPDKNGVSRFIYNREV